MTFEEVEAIVGDIEIGGMTLRLHRDKEFGYLQGHYQEECVVTKEMAWQHTAKERVDDKMILDEIVFKAVKLAFGSADHRVREHFRYRGEQIISPHLSVNALWRLAHDRQFAVRDTLPIAAVNLEEKA